MNKILLPAISIVLFLSCSAEKRLFVGKDFSTSNYENLSSKTESIIRESHTELDILSYGKARLKVKYAATILNKNVKDLAQLVVYYSSLQNIDYIKANIIDGDGNLVQSYTESDANDYSSYDGFSFFSDNRVKVLDLNYNRFPYTIEVEYQKNLNGTLYFPAWYPQDLNQKVESAYLKVIDRTGDAIRYKLDNFDVEPEIADLSSVKEYNWHVTNLEAVDRDPLGPPVQEILPRVLLAPTKFEIEGTIGNATSWQEFGKWYHELGKDAMELPDEAKREVDQVLQGLTTEHEKVEALYRYMQSKTRYVSIQLGIGGWKPFPAEYVYKNEYGDCKALTNYMQAILEYAGINSNAVLIRSGLDTPPIEADFSSNQFNHVILRVQLSNGEVVWLECTSKYFPPGHIGSANEGKKSLMITEEGGQIIETPISTSDENTISTYSEIQLHEDGFVNMDSKIQTKGAMLERVLNILKPISDNARIDWLKEQIDESSAQNLTANFDGIDNQEPSFQYTIDIKNYSSNSSNRLFVPLKTYNSIASVGLDLEPKRAQDVWLDYPYTEVDEVVYKIPENYQLESAPEDETFERNFGKYELSFELKDQQLVQKRVFVLNERKLEAEQYNSFVLFLRQVKDADNQRLVLKRSD